MFSSLTGPRFPNQSNTVGAQSGGAINNPQGAVHPAWGCDAHNTATVQVLSSDGSITKEHPYFDFQTLVDSMQTAGVTWKYYAPGFWKSGYISRSDLWVLLEDSLT